MNIIKRDGKEVEFDVSKIENAVRAANNEVRNEDEQLTETQIKVIGEKVERKLRKQTHAATVEQIQDLVIHAISEQQAFTVAQLYTEYRYKQALRRKANSTDKSILSLLDYNNEELKQENSNKNPMIASTQRDYMAGEVSKDLTTRVLLPQDIVEADEKGILHFHDKDYYAMKIHNCDLINLEDMLQNGTVISGTMIEKPHRLSTAANVTTQIVAQVASNQYGGQTFSLAHLAPFVDLSRQRNRQKIKEDFEAAGVSYTEEQVNEIAESMLKREITDAIQTVQYQLITLMTTNGQTPFVSMAMNLGECPEGRLRDDMALLIEEVLKQRRQGVKNEKGVWVIAAFPKLLYHLDEFNARKGSPYYYLTEEAARCTAATMVPDYISNKKMREFKGDVYPCMGCRAFLTPDRFTDKGVGNIANARNYDEEAPHHRYYGRFNAGVVTLNLVDIACSSGGDMTKFWNIMDERLELAHRALKLRHERLRGTHAGIAPILWQYGALARLNKFDVIDPLLYNGYSTLSLGYAGLYECCLYMTDRSHTDPDTKPFALAIMQRMNDACQAWKAVENIDYSTYGTPIESVTYKFAKALQERFGIIEGVTDHNYITNSYHVNVREEIDAFDKLRFEAEFQALSPGGAISYIEVPDMKDNIEAVLQVIEFIYDNIIYAELNTKSDYCMDCGYNGEIKAVENEHGKLVWKCPQCGNEVQENLFIARRTCGYIGTQKWNQGRTQEIRDRVLHL